MIYDLGSEAAAIPSAPVSTHPRRPMSPASARLTWVAASLALAASMAGLLIDGIYAGDVSTGEMLRGYDLVTAVVVVPVLAIETRAARHGFVLPRLVTLGLLAYLVYTYAFYLFGSGFNDLFLLHVAVLATGLCALILEVASIDSSSVAAQLNAKSGIRSAAAILGALAVGLFAMWVYSAVVELFSGEVPSGSALVETETVVHVGMILDLSLLVPLYSVAAVLLWRRATWGFVLAGISLFAGIVHQLAYMVAMPFQEAASVAGAVSFDPAEPVILLLYAVATALLVLSSRRHSNARAFKQSRNP